jgi:hypothetical protein
MVQLNKIAAMDQTENEKIQKKVKEVKDKKVLKVKKAEKVEKEERRVEKEAKVKEKILTGAHSNLHALNKILLVGKNGLKLKFHVKLKTKSV